MKLSANRKFSYDSRFSLGADDSGNILVQGDNRTVLPELLPMFAGRVKCVYIDPPYNNGESYHYYDDNVGHESWLKCMRDVLEMLRPLLTEDGSVWMSIDDKEMAYLKVEADKVFGRGNFIASIIWQQRKTRENRATFSYNHEYILVYSKDSKRFKKSRNCLPVDADFISRKYKNPDNDPRGPWQSVSANVQAGHGVKSQFYAITSPSGIVHNPPKGRCWIYSEERMKREIANGNIWFGKDGRNSPRLKKFLANAKVGLTPETIWLADAAGTSDGAKKQLKVLFPAEKMIFETPKPEELLKRILEIASNKGDYVLDCFLGSGTTVAVAHKMSRRYIGIEVGDQMSRLVVERLRLVASGEQTGISKIVNWKGGGSFAFYNLKGVNERLRVSAERDGLSVASISNNIHGIRHQQLRLAIEKQREYKGTAAAKGAAKKCAAKPKTNDVAKSKRPKSVKARYGKKR